MAIMSQEEIKALATETVKRAAADNYNKEYGYPDGTTLFKVDSATGESTVVTEPGEGIYRGYKPEDVDPDQILLSIDLVAFVIWLRNDTDYFSGPNLDIHFPEATSPEFLDVLGQNVIIYTGE